MISNRMDCSRKLDDALQYYYIAYKTTTGMSPYQIVDGKSCHLSVALKNKAICVMKKIYFDWGATSTKRVNYQNFLEEFCLKACESAAFFKENMKKYHDQRIENRYFIVGDHVLIFNSRLQLFLGELKSMCSRPFLLKQVFPFGAREQ